MFERRTRVHSVYTNREREALAEGRLRRCGEMFSRRRYRINRHKQSFERARFETQQR